MKTTKRHAHPRHEKTEGDAPTARGTTAAPARSAVALGVLRGREGALWRVATGGGEATASVDAAVDPALLDEANAQGARVLLDVGASTVIVGVVATRRAVTVDAQGDVHARVRRWSVEAREEAVHQTPGAFVRLKGGDVEVYGLRVLLTARELLKALGRMVKIN